MSDDTEPHRKIMVKPVDLGSYLITTISTPMYEYEKENAPGKVMGYVLPSFQRPLIWTEEQNISLIESIWKGVSIGTYTFNRSRDLRNFDNYLLDGQQRLHAIQKYIEDGFKVYGYFWSELTDVDRRFFESFHFCSYITYIQTEQELRDHYNMLNFSGVRHTEDQKA